MVASYSSVVVQCSAWPGSRCWPVLRTAASAIDEDETTVYWYHTVEIQCDHKRNRPSRC